MNRISPLFAAVIVLFVGACGGTVDPGGGDTPIERSFDFPEGDFQFTTTVVEDQCADGGLNLLFMPEGPERPWNWTYPVHLYPPEALPKTYEIPLREPFGAMTVTIERASSVEEWVRGAQNDAVRLGDSYGECVADLGANVDLVLVSTDRVNGHGALEMRNPRGDPNCPVFPEACEVLLTIEANRLTGSD